MNLLLANVIEGYSKLRKESDALLTPVLINKLLNKWQEFDPKGTGFISIMDYIFLINDLEAPLGRRNMMDIA